jgi:hypothetical protein
MLQHRFLHLFSLVPSLLLAACGGGAATAGTSAGGDGGSIADGGGGGGDTASSSSSGSGGEPAAKPIDAPAEQWTWVPFDDAFCANGTPTGIGANITDKSNKVVIYLMGGGACWDSFTCYSLKTAVNIDTGYGEAQFENDSKSLTGSLFNRNDPANPLRDASYFFVPYCTGDVHAGANPDADYGGTKTLHVGSNNMKAYLERIVATFPNAERVVLSGSSAGGFGAGFNWWQAQQMFGDVRVDLVDDSGPPLPSPYLSEALEGQWRAAWNLNATLPEGCTECQTDLSAIFGFYAKNLPKNRAALLSYTQDQVIAAYLQIPEAQVAEGLGVLAEKMDTYENARYFYVEGNSHVLLGNPAGISQNGVVLMDWLGQMLGDDPTWASVKP